MRIHKLVIGSYFVVLGLCLGLLPAGCNELLEEQLSPDQQFAISELDSMGCALVDSSVFVALTSPNVNKIDSLWISDYSTTVTQLDTVQLSTSLVLRNLHSGKVACALLPAAQSSYSGAFALYVNDQWSVMLVGADGDTVASVRNIPLETLAACPSIAVRLTFSVDQQDYLVIFDQAESTLLDYYSGSPADIASAFHFVLLKDD